MCFWFVAAAAVSSNKNDRQPKMATTKIEAPALIFCSGFAQAFHIDSSTFYMNHALVNHQ